MYNELPCMFHSLFSCHWGCLQWPMKCMELYLIHHTVNYHHEKHFFTYSEVLMNSIICLISSKINAPCLFLWVNFFGGTSLSRILVSENYIWMFLHIPERTRCPGTSYHWPEVILQKNSRETTSIALWIIWCMRFLTGPLLIIK